MITNVLSPVQEKIKQQHYIKIIEQYSMTKTSIRVKFDIVVQFVQLRRAFMVCNNYHKVTIAYMRAITMGWV